jgi:hypothetical protein
MPLPTSINDLSTVAGSNYPAGTDSPVVLDDVQRAHASFIAQLRDSRDSLSASSGSSLVGYLPAGTGAVATTVQTKLLDTVSVKDFGAVGDGVTDDSAAFELALAAHDNVFVPDGSYLINNITGLRSNSTLYGNGWGTELIQKSGAGVNDHVLDMRHNSNGGTTSVADNLTGITVKNLKIRGYSATPVFLEQSHLVAMCAVSDVLFDSVFFSGFKGDAVYIGSGDSGLVERHNENITFRKCVFDGVNNENRNGISIIDVDGLLIDDCTFKRTTKSTMPGAIDIEPNSNAYHIVKNITVRKVKIDNCRGGLMMTIPNNLTTPISNILWEDFSITNTTQALGIGNSFSTTALSITDASQKITIQNGVVKNGGSPISVTGVTGLKVKGVSFQDCTATGLVGSGSNARLLSWDVEFDDNTFIRCGSVGVSAISFDGINGLVYTNNRHIDCGDNSVNGAALDFIPAYAGAVVVSKFAGNSFQKSALANMIATKETGAGSVTNIYESVFSNSYNGLTSYFPADSGTFTPIIVGGTTAGTGTYTFQSGNWRRDGDMCFVEAVLIQTAHTGTGTISLNFNDLPFTCKSSSGNNLWPLALSTDTLAIGAGKVASIGVLPNTKNALLIAQDQAGGAAAALTLAADVTFKLYVSGNFQIA